MNMSDVPAATLVTQSNHDGPLDGLRAKVLPPGTTPYNEYNQHTFDTSINSVGRTKTVTGWTARSYPLMLYSLTDI